ARYADQLKTDFPRLPLTSDAALFRALCALGARLLALHLMRSPPPPRISYPIAGSHRVERVRYIPPSADREPGRVWLNATQHVEGVTPAVWGAAIGGYRVAQKWLKDRTGRTLTRDELEQYQSVLVALRTAEAVGKQFDAAIARYGGWPLAG